MVTIQLDIRKYPSINSIIMPRLRIYLYMYNLTILDLEPATWYVLRITAHNNAGFNVAEYEFATLTMTGGKLLN